MNRLPKACYFHYRILNPNHNYFHNLSYANAYFYNPKVLFRLQFNRNDFSYGLKSSSKISFLQYSSMQAFNSFNNNKLFQAQNLATLPYIKFNDNPPCDMYKSKTSFELVKNLLVLELCSFKFIVENANKVIAATRKVLGKKLCDKLIKSTMFYQFVAGETIEEAVKELRNLEKSGVAPFIAVPVEEIPFDPNNKELWRNKLTQNVNYIMESLRLYAANFKDRQTVINFKLSALIPLQAMAEFGSKVLPELCETKGFSCLDFDLAKLKDLKEFKTNMSENDRHLIITGLESLENIAEYARDNRIKILIDSEYSTVNRTISFFTKILMQRFNKDFPTIGATYQCYFKNMPEMIKKDVNDCEMNNVVFSCKIVRGAYMDWENRLAASKGVPSPICDSHQMTCQTYDAVLKYCLEKIYHENARCYFMVASHNVDSVNLTLKMMKDLSIPFTDSRVSFAQLYGMCNYLTSFLSHNTGALVYKNIPYGPVDSVVPYLLRRAEENASVFERLSAEKKYLMAELVVRFKELFGVVRSKPTFGSGPPTTANIHHHRPTAP